MCVLNIPSPLPLYHLYTQALLRLLSLPHATKCPGGEGACSSEEEEEEEERLLPFMPHARETTIHMSVGAWKKKSFIFRKTWYFSPLANFELVLQSHVLACLRHSSRAFPLCKYLAEEERGEEVGEEMQRSSLHALRLERLITSGHATKTRFLVISDEKSCVHLFIPQTNKSLAENFGDSAHARKRVFFSFLFFFLGGEGCRIRQSRREGFSLSGGKRSQRNTKCEKKPRYD